MPGGLQSQSGRAGSLGDSDPRTRRGAQAATNRAAITTPPITIDNRGAIALVPAINYVPTATSAAGGATLADVIVIVNQLRADNLALIQRLRDAGLME
jgi:hypothetical protein